MKAKTNFKKGSRMAWSFYILLIKSLIFSALILTGIHAPLQAQDVQYTRPSWWFGAAAGANINFYTGTTQQLNADLFVPTAFNKGMGVGLYLAPLLEYHKPDSRWGFMLQAGYDGRNGKFDQILTPCNCPADLSAKLSYITVEPSLRIAPFKSNFYLYVGPRLAFNLGKSFDYKIAPTSSSGEVAPPSSVSDEFSDMKSMLISMQIGAGYDIQLSSQNKHTQWVLSPFAAFHPYFGQRPRSIETWDVSTLRLGAAIKFGRGHKIEPERVTEAVVPEPEVTFSVNSPMNIPVERRVRETFPVRNYVFFNLGSTEIPDRYVLITKDQVKDFTEDRLEVFKPKKLSGRSDRQMIVYYNILNILGTRMINYPSAIVRLSGASQKGPEDGKLMAETVKRYLVDVFGINPSRINTEGRDKPRIPSEQVGATKELELLREGDQRVSIWSESPEILMEYQTGPNTPLKPVEVIDLQEAPLDSYVTFNVKGAKEAFSSWSLEIKDENGKVQYFGPYTQENVAIPGKSILGTRPEGNYKVTMVGKTKSGNTVRKDSPYPVHMVLWTPPKDEEGMRYSVIFEFNESETTPAYEKYLTDIVTPKIPRNGTVILHGHTDIIGDEVNNRELSLARANQVRSIIENSLSKAGRSDVKIEVYGFGEDENLAPFENNYPEERFYNRAVLIDIIPAK